MDSNVVHASVARRARPLHHRFMSLLKRKRILLLEDDPSMQRLIVHVLKRLHVKVELFGEGRDVIARIAARHDRYAALLLDVMMPHDGGLSVLRNLREHHPTLLQKVILVTASGTGITDRWSHLVYAVVHKPFDGAALAKTVQECVRPIEQQPSTQAAAASHGS